MKIKKSICETCENRFICDTCDSGSVSVIKCEYLDMSKHENLQTKTNTKTF